jgi:nicotinic acid mononucleotide adenylyltransferase
VVALASVVIVDRPGVGQPDLSELAGLGLDPARVIKCHFPTPDVSGSALRRAVAARQLVTGQVPPAVELYIAERNLYGDNR